MEEFTNSRFGIKIENGIVHVVFNKEHVDYSLVNEGIIKRLELTKEKSYPMFSDIRMVKSSTREARERMGAKDAGVGINAVAILISSKIQKITYNFFNSIYKAPAPTKLFTDKDKALKWLEQFK